MPAWHVVGAMRTSVALQKASLHAENFCAFFVRLQSAAVELQLSDLHRELLAHARQFTSLSGPGDLDAFQEAETLFNQGDPSSAALHLLDLAHRCHRRLWEKFIGFHAFGPDVWSSTLTPSNLIPCRLLHELRYKVGNILSGACSACASIRRQPRAYACECFWPFCSGGTDAIRLASALHAHAELTSIVHVLRQVSMTQLGCKVLFGV
eukprot:6207691-Pleurochrysis_carterae.AAC.1